MTEQVSGQIVFRYSAATSVVRTETMTAIATQSFQGNGLGLFLFRLQIANDPALTRVTQVWLGMASYIPVTSDNNSSHQEGESKTTSSMDWSSGTMIAVVVSVAAALVAVCIFTFLLVCRH